MKGTASIIGRGGRAASRVGAIVTALCMLGMATPAFADDKARIAELERKLEQGMQMIRVLQAEIEQMKAAQAASEAKTQQIVQSAVAEQAERLDEVEESVVGIEDRAGSRALVSAFDAQSLDIGGFLHQTFTYVDGEDASSESFNKTVFELLLRAQLNENWTAFVAQAFARESPDPFSPAAGGSRERPHFISGGTDTETVLAWANYRVSDAFNVRFGRLISPQGIVNIQHFPAALLDPEQPQFLRPFGSDTLFANFTTGIELHGQKFFGQDHLAWSAYGGNFAGNGDELIYGTRGAWTFGNSGITVGLNYNGGERRPGFGGNFDVFGADLKIDRDWFEFTGEVFASDESSNTFDSRTAWYVQPAFRFAPGWTAFYRYDFLDNGLNQGDSVENVVGLTYKPLSNLHLRASLTVKDFDEGATEPAADARIFQVSGTLSF